MRRAITTTAVGVALPFSRKCEHGLGPRNPSRSDESARRERRVPARFVTYALALMFLVISASAVAQNATAVNSFRDCPDCPEMVTIPPGTFMMGASKEQADRFRQNANLLDRLEPIGATHAQPQHNVVISQAFAIGKYPVTRGEFARFVHETGYDASNSCLVRIGRRRPSSVGSWSRPGFEQEDHDPVVCVTWADANAYIGWLNKKIQSPGATAKAGLYRLPSEAEYEYAARGGTTTLRWWGDDIGRNKAVCNGCQSQWDGQQPAPVGLFGANQYGVYDILGNVWEWTQDCWNSNYEQAPTDGAPWLAGDCKFRVERGGSWQSGVWAESSIARSRYDQSSGDSSIGFRVGKSLQ
jgi:formylglycine-generating enzyme required for sulfatase activity